jgi:hypothetical protein
MGLDLIPEGRAKPGCEREWRQLIEQYFSGGEASAEQKARFNEIIIPAYQCAGAPRVGTDRRANQWIIEARNAKTEEEIAECLKTYHGYYVLELVGPPACPLYTNAPISDTLDRTSFRGSFLEDCASLLDKDLLADAWNNKMPEEAVAYGRKLLQAAEKADPKNTGGLRRWFGGGKNREKLQEQLNILRAAGEWYIFWGEHGHPIRAWS